MFLIKLTKEKATPACLIWLLLIRAGIEQNPGPWTCSLCHKKLTSYSVECTTCHQWLHIKCSGFKSHKERLKYTIWKGPCCTTPQPLTPQTHSPTASHFSPPPPLSPPPPPPPPPPQEDPDQTTAFDFKILQYNINGISGKIEELLNYMEANTILIAAIQETKLTSKSKPLNTNDYTLVRKDRGKDKGGGIAFLVHESVPFEQIPESQTLANDPHLESLTISIKGKDDNLQIRNIYLPPVSSCEQQYNPPIEHIFNNLNTTSMILGDFNAHHELWNSEATQDNRGRLIADTINEKPFGVLNEDTPTRTTAISSTSPDISIVSNNLLAASDWKTEVKLSSDHLPITINIKTEIKKIKSPDREYINFGKADWDSFHDYTESCFNNAYHTGNVCSDERFFRKTLQDATRKFIPGGRIMRVANEVPTEAMRQMDERDRIRKDNPSDPRIPNMNNNIQKDIKFHRRDKFIKHLDKCQPNTKDLWTFIKKLEGQPKQPKNQGISFGDQTLNNPQKIADKLNCQFTPTSNKKPTQPTRNILRNLKKPPKDPEVVITEEQTAKAIKAAKNSKALGPDDISPQMLKNLGPHGIKFLTNIYNQCVNTSTIPSLWKTSRIIPLLKPGKPADQSTSQRPISLLSPPAKILESILLPEVTAAINLANHQHGFRKGHSTASALQNINSNITSGLNRNKPVNRTVVVAIDLSRAFDTVDHDILMNDLYHLNINDRIKRFLCAYIRGRQTYVEFRGSVSTFRKMRLGVPQGGVLSPILFNLYMSKMPQPPGNILLDTYADDTTLQNSGPKYEPLCQELSLYLDTLDDWFKERNLFISPSKSTATIFSTFSGDCNIDLPVYIKGDKVPTVKKPKLLGVTYDNLFNFGEHASNMKTKVQSRNNVLKALAGTTWGKEKEVIVNTYKAIGQSIFNYCCPIWGPSLSGQNWKELQIAQNTALRTALGCVKMTDIDHLHSECKIMPVKDHCDMLSKQYLLSSQQESHPNNNIDLDFIPPQNRLMKKTLVSEFGAEIKNKIPPEGLNSTNRKFLLKEIHTESVTTTISKQAHNKVLNTPAPKVDVTEKTLPRKARSSLAQLRSGYSSMLNSYLARIRQDVQDICPDCNQPNHTTIHLFNCPAKPTDLNVHSLWTKPVEAAQFLGLLDGQENDDHG